MEPVTVLIKVERLVVVWLATAHIKRFLCVLAGLYQLCSHSHVIAKEHMKLSCTESDLRSSYLL